MHSHSGKVTSSPRIAIVHDLIAEFGGAERVLMSLMQMFPHARLYTAFVDPERLGKHRSIIEGWDITTSFLRFVPYIGRIYSPLRFLMPLVWRSFNLSSYDIVICSSSWGMCKGVSMQKSNLQPSSFRDNPLAQIPNVQGHSPVVYPEQSRRAIPAKGGSASGGRNSPVYLCYLHTPPRYLYGYDESPLKKYWIVRVYALVVNHFLRQYDFLSSQSIDQFIFNSEEVRARSLKYYRKDGIVIHPPIRNHQVPDDHRSRRRDRTYYLTVSRLAPTKHIDLLIQACNMRGIALKVVGSGKEYSRLKRMAGPTVEMLGSVSDEELNKLYAGARGFLYASLHEDFGMVPVEAMAYGVPVIAHASGGVKETVIDSRNGYLYHTLAPRSILEKIDMLEALDDPGYENMCQEARAFAQTCSQESFVSKIHSIIAKISSSSYDQSD